MGHPHDRSRSGPVSACASRSRPGEAGGDRAKNCRLCEKYHAQSKTPVWWFGNPLHSRSRLFKRISEPNHTGIIGFLVSFESEVRPRASRRMKRTSDSDTSGLLAPAIHADFNVNQSRLGYRFHNDCRGWRFPFSGTWAKVRACRPVPHSRVGMRSTPSEKSLQAHIDTCWIDASGKRGVSRDRQERPT